MNAITRRNTTTLAVPAEMSAELRTWLWQDYDGARFGMECVDEGPGIIILSRNRSALTTPLVAEAAALLPGYRAMLPGPSAVYLKAWLEPLSVLVRNPLDAAAFAALVPLFADALAEIPLGALTEKTRRRALTTFKFWPSPADVAELVQDEAREIRRAVAVLGYLAARES